MLLHVSDKFQGGPLSYVVKFDVELELKPALAGVKIEVSSVLPRDADPVLVAEAVKSIRHGAERALRSHGLGGNIRLCQLLVHDVDFSPKKFEQVTFEFLAKHLETVA